MFIAYYSLLSLILILCSTLSCYILLKNNSSKLKIVLSLILVTIPFIIVKMNNLSEDSNYLFIAISYISLKQIHYIWESYKAKLKVHNFWDFLAFLVFFPSIFVGPINIFNDFIRDLNRRRFDSQLISYGFERILFGYAKVVILSAYITTTKFSEYLNLLDESAYKYYLECWQYGLNLYFQFSGYTDIVLGFSVIMGFRLIENFNKPFLAININDFWQRWHISLSNWCREYVFMPVMSITRIPSLSILASMIALGLWHEFTTKYLIWALYHGLGIVVWHLFQKIKPQLYLKSKLFPKLINLLAILITLNFVVLSFAITKEDSLNSSFNMILKIIGVY